MTRTILDRCWALLWLGLAFTMQAAIAAEPSKATNVKPAFTPPYPERVDPFRQPINKEALVSRHASVQQLDLKLKGFVNVGTRKAVFEINGKMVALGAGDSQNEIQVLDMNEQAVTLQRGRHRWTESLLETSRSVQATEPTK